VDVLPELGDGAGEVGGVAQGVVGEAVVGVPGVPTALPRQVLCRHKDSRVSINVTSLKGSGEKRNLGSFELKCICLFLQRELTTRLDGQEPPSQKCETVFQNSHKL